MKPIISKLIKDFSSGKKCILEISQKHNLTLNETRKIYYRLREKYNLPKLPQSIIIPHEKRNYRRKSNLDSEINYAYNLYQNGLTLRDLAEKYNITFQRVQQLFAKHNLPLKPRSRYRKYTHCSKGHELHAGENRKRCTVCIKERKEFRAKGLHLKTHCNRGHALVEGNLYHFINVNGKPARRCKTCASEKVKNYYHKKKLKG